MKLSQTEGYRLEIERCSPESPEPTNSTSYIQSLNNTFNGFNYNQDWTNYYQEQYNMEENYENVDDWYYDDTDDTDDYGYYDDYDFYNDQYDYDDQDDYEDVDSRKVGVEPPTFFTAPCYFNYYQKLFKLPRQYRVQFYYVNTVINAVENDYIKLVVDYQEFLIELTNDSTLRIEADFFLDSYEVITNNNIFNDYPLGVQNKSGFIKMRPIEVHSFIYDPHNTESLTSSTQNEKMNNYFTLDIKKSNQVLHVDRYYQTIEGLFQQIGGYLAFFSTFFAYLFLSYNQLCFQLQIVSNLYFKKTNQPIQASNPSYQKFLIYKIWRLLGKINIRPQWQFCLEWEEISAQASKVLDMQTVVRKIQHLQKVGKAVLDQEKYYALYLEQPQNLEDQKNKMDADIVYNKLRSKYFNEGEINETELNKFRIVKAMIDMQKQKNQRPSLSDEIKNQKDNNVSAKKYSMISQISGKKGPNDDNIETESKADERENLEILKEQLQDESDEDYIKPEMYQKLKSYLEKMKAASKNDSVAARIYEAIDPNIKCIMLNEEIPKKANKESIIAEPIVHELSTSTIINQKSSTSLKIFPENNSKK